MARIKRSVSNVQDEIDKIKTLAEVSEAYLVGIIWSDPIKYSSYIEKISTDDFIHKQWKKFFALAQNMLKQKLQTFDMISTKVFVEEKNIEDWFDEIGGYDTIDEIVSIVKENAENIETYYIKLKKNKLLTSLYELYGDKVFINTKDYNYQDMDSDEIVKYWQYQSSISMLSVEKNYTTDTLYINGESFLESLGDKDKDLMPFYDSKFISKVVKGIPRGEVTIIGGFGNSGKSSFIVDKVLMSMLDSKDRTLIILNEESALSFQIRLVLSVINHHLNEDRKGFTRRKLLEVNDLTDVDKNLITKAWEKVDELLDYDKDKIKIVYMEQYRINELKEVVRMHAAQGYVNLIIDTHKVPDQYKESSRWEAYVEATKEIYKFTRAEAGGFNLRTVLSIQLADSHIGDRFLSFDAIGEGKAMKNEASTVLMFRPLFSDEYDKLSPYVRIKGGLSGGKEEWVKKEISLNKDETYYLLFIPKNRQGANTDTGQDCILLQPNFEFNSFRELGYVKVNRSF